MNGMKRELVFLVEELSAKAMLEGLLPRMLSPEISFRVIPFEGKQDLEKQMERKLRAYCNPRARFIVMRDQDSNPDCIGIKNRLLQKCVQAGHGNTALVRIACRELESFYLADLVAVENALGIPGLAKKQEIRKYRAPDHLGAPSEELKVLTRRRYQKVNGSRELGKHLDPDNERSFSFKNLVAGIRRMERALFEI